MAGRAKADAAVGSADVRTASAVDADGIVALALIVEEPLEPTVAPTGAGREALAELGAAERDAAPAREQRDDGTPVGPAKAQSGRQVHRMVFVA